MRKDIFLPTSIFENLVEFCKIRIFTKKCSCVLRIGALDKFTNITKSTALSPETCLNLLGNDHQIVELALWSQT